MTASLYLCRLPFFTALRRPTYRNVATVPTGNVDPAVTQAVGAAASGGTGSGSGGFGGGNFAGAGAQQQPTINSVVGAYINQAVQCACRNSFRCVKQPPTHQGGCLLASS